MEYLRNWGHVYNEGRGGEGKERGDVFLFSNNYWDRGIQFLCSREIISIVNVDLKTSLDLPL